MRPALKRLASLAAGLLLAFGSLAAPATADTGLPD
jgi:hypothetical protein